MPKKAKSYESLKAPPKIKGLEVDSTVEEIKSINKEILEIVISNYDIAVRRLKHKTDIKSNNKSIIHMLNDLLSKYRLRVLEKNDNILIKKVKYNK